MSSSAEGRADMDLDGVARKRQHQGEEQEGEKMPKHIVRLLPPKIPFNLFQENRAALTEIMQNFDREFRLRASSFRMGVPWFPGTGDRCHRWLSQVEWAIAGLFAYVNRIREMRLDDGDLSRVSDFLDELDKLSSEATPIDRRINLGEHASSKLVDMRDCMTRILSATDTCDAEANPGLGTIAWTK